MIFARSFRDESNPDQAFGSNIAGSVIGGLAESFSTLLAFRHLLILAIGSYILSAWTPSMRAKQAFPVNLIASLTATLDGSAAANGDIDARLIRYANAAPSCR